MHVEYESNCWLKIHWMDTLNVWKVAGSILDGVIGNFHGHNPFGHAIVLG
jgi:hypothetical protein